ncbi:MAG: hypothetical protein J1F01_06370 [Oscillospiraceae bacterium]|nr:hypothetical protein [Oscillospiraceae bacterium]
MKKKKIIALCAVAFIGATAFIGSFVVRGANVYYDFENGVFEWQSLYGNADYEFLTEDSGNKYLKLTYNGNEGRDRTYFDVPAYKGTYITSKTIQATYDVKYSEIKSSRNGEIQFKERTGPGSSETTIVARVAKDQGYFQVRGTGFQRIKDLNGQYLPVEVDRWYTIRVVVDLANHLQSVYISDRDTGSLLALYENFATSSDIDSINMISFSSTTDMCLDNVKIYEPSCESGYIYGNPYIKKGTKSTFYFVGQGSDGDVTTMPTGTTTWSLEKSKTGVSINGTTGVLTTSSSIEPGIVIIKAERTVDGVKYENKYAVNITN